MKKVVILLIVLVFIPIVVSVDMSDTTVTSEGLNTTIEISTFNVSFDELEVTDRSITFYNLTYTNPQSCDNQQSSITMYNITDGNSTATFTFIPCSGGGGGGGLLTTVPPTDEVEITAKDSILSTIINKIQGLGTTTLSIIAVGILLAMFIGGSLEAKKRRLRKIKGKELKRQLELRKNRRKIKLN